MDARGGVCDATCPRLRELPGQRSCLGDVGHRFPASRILSTTSISADQPLHPQTKNQNQDLLERPTLSPLQTPRFTFLQNST